MTKIDKQRIVNDLLLVFNLVLRFGSFSRVLFRLLERLWGIQLLAVVDHLIFEIQRMTQTAHESSMMELALFEDDFKPACPISSFWAFQIFSGDFISMFYDFFTKKNLGNPTWRFFSIFCHCASFDVWKAWVPATHFEHLLSPLFRDSFSWQATQVVLPTA